MVCGGPATVPDCTARAFSLVHLRLTCLRRARRERTRPGRDTEVPFSHWNAGRKTGLSGKRTLERWEKGWGFCKRNMETLNPWGWGAQLLKFRASGRGPNCKSYCLHVASPVSVLPWSILSSRHQILCALMFFFRRYLGVARPAETWSVRQTGLKLSKYLHIFLLNIFFVITFNTRISDIIMIIVWLGK